MGSTRHQEHAPEEKYDQVHDPFRSSEQGSARNFKMDSSGKGMQQSSRNEHTGDMSTSGTTTWDESTNHSEDLSTMSMSTSNKRTKMYAVLIVLVGVASSVAFTYFGIKSHKKESEDAFDRRSSELVQVIHNAFQDYETAVRNTHSICRRDRQTTRHEFQEHYEYIVADGQLNFQALQCAPRVTHAERSAYEEEAKGFYEAEYPETVDYQGFKGFEMNNATGIVGVMPRSAADFYWPIHYSEPVIPNAGALGLDIYSSSSQYREIDLAVATRQAVLSARLKLVQDTTGAYSVIIRHPGILLSDTTPEEDPVEDLACLLVRVPSLLTHVAQMQEESLAAYAYDTTEFNTGGSTDFLGAAEYYIELNENTGGMDTVIRFPEEIEIDDLRQQHRDSKLLYEESIPIASGTWKIVVVPVDDTYEASNGFVWFGGAMILLTALGLAAYLVRNMFQVNAIYEAKQEAETERNIVASLFPESVIARLTQDAKAKREALKDRKRNKKMGNEKQALLDSSSSRPQEAGRLGKEFRRASMGLDGRGSAAFNTNDIFGGKPIAEFHPDVTILCANLCGFTAWASVRAPEQVFTLLETIFHAFDMIAKRRRVFKVETIGDCYVAAAGVPEPRENHAVIMARFATDIMHRVRIVAHELEKSLGPETSDIDLRIGLHSGAVTAGVLRGDKGRFQLFGNTFNITQLMESTGTRGRIQASSDTRDLLEAVGKGNWLKARAGKTTVRGKGEMQTYFVDLLPEGKGSVELSTPSSHNRAPLKRQITAGGTGERLVDWNARELTKLLRTVMAQREAKSKAQILDTSNGSARGGSKRASFVISATTSSNLTPLEEVKDVIALPKFDAESFTAQFHTKEITLERNVVKQLHALVTKISTLYKSNPFHNFEHASHVAMSVTKMLTRIANPKEIAIQKKAGSLDFERAAKIHDHTLGITSDPLTHFAAFFAALIHDAGHVGVPNTTLIQEDPSLAFKYNDTSVAEQNSLDICWDLLMQDTYVDLRRCICADADELAHFRELLILMVMSTDVMDKDLNKKRKDRWNMAFSDDTKELRASEEDRNRKATIIIEHLIQASDVSHTMQHWNIYSKWNRRLFMELYHAYQEGRMDKDPSEGWYQGEIGFLDFYVIPLARKLDTCGVFGVSSSEFAFYASENRKEWEVYGKDMVTQYLDEYHTEHPDSSKGSALVATPPKEDEGSTLIEDFSITSGTSEDCSEDMEAFSDEVSC